jgi:hypothetical protein
LSKFLDMQDIVDLHGGKGPVKEKPLLEKSG